MYVTFSSPPSAVDPADLVILAEKVTAAFPASSQSKSLRFRNALTLTQRQSPRESINLNAIQMLD